MKTARLTGFLVAGALAGMIGLHPAKAQDPVSVTLTDVWSQVLPTGFPASQTVSGGSQIRSFAVNNNPGSPWKGTVYLPRRPNAGAAGETGPGQVFYWTGTSTLTPSGPNLANPDGQFDTAAAAAAGFDITTGNAPWGIGVDDADYVYVAGLNQDKLLRFDPDGTDPVLVIPTGFSEGKFARQLTVTGKGLDTRIMFVTDSRTPNAAIVWKATAVDANNAPTAFEKTVLFALPTAGSQHHQAVWDSDRSHIYYTVFGEPTSPRKVDVATGTPDPNFPEFIVANSTGLAIDSMDRALYTVVFNNGTVYALDPVTGADITANTPFTPANLSGTSFGWYIELQRYSDRHYFYMGSQAPPNVLGIFSTDLPAPAPDNLVVTNPGTGNSLTLNWVAPDDPEVAGYNVYRSTTAGTQGTKLNTTLVTSTNYTDTSLTSGTRYYYVVESVGLNPFTNAQYDGLESTQASNIPLIPDVPAAPTNISVTNTQVGGQVRVNWTTPAQFAETINIYRSTTAGQLGTLVAQVENPDPGQQGTYLDTGLTNGTPYFYTVKAENGIGQESTNTQQFSAVPTDETAPTFAGVSSAVDLGFPGLRLTWNSAADVSGPVTYNIYAGPSPSEVNYGSPIATTTEAVFDLIRPLGEDTFIAVRAEDAFGNEDSNTKVVSATPTRVIVDPDQNGGVNNNLFNPQPDTAVDAMLPAPFASRKGSAPDLVDSGFAAGQFYYQLNTVKAKAGYTIPIPQPGTYEISAYFPSLVTADLTVNSPNYTYHITFPDGSTQDVVVNQDSTTGGRWLELVGSKQLTAGTMTVIGENQVDPLGAAGDVTVSSAIRARLLITPTTVTIYRAATPPSIDAQINPAEWSGASTWLLGRAYQDILPGQWTGPLDYTARVQMKWDDNNLYVAAEVINDVLAFPDTPENQLFLRDALEIYLGLAFQPDPDRTEYLIPGDYQLILSADRNATTGALTGRYYSPQTLLSGANVSARATDYGYVLEASLPWSGFEGAFFSPAVGTEIGFNLQGLDNDSTEPAQQSAFSFSGQAGSFNNPQAWISAILAGTPPAAVKGDVNGDGVFSRDDVSMALRIAGGLLPATRQQVQAGDVAGGDGRITVQDAVLLNRALNGLATL